MAKKKRGAAHAGGHGWFVTFADLMGLMMSFFVMLVAFSTMDNNKLKIVAGSMREAFGVQTEARYAGIIESDGLPTRPKLKNVDHISPEESSNTPTPDEQERSRTAGARLKIDREFALASASLRQALQDMPELTEISKHIMFEETKEGLNLEIVDQDGRSMFPDGSKVPYERTRRLVQKLAGPLKATPLRISIAGHTAAGYVPSKSDYGAFDLSADRANAVRQILEREGLPPAHIFAVSGKADNQPLFPDDPSLSANRRVTITLMREDPPLPPDLKP
ncbi:MAG TPA: flagellar motor protein MotB [Bradyrhizobium sp.]|jgi:chemotaxis protein MotB|uniref:flagellar motor protein MotB n=1 Tax=Bradyrhizobium sp. TaxID=376 RepID=UPI002C61E237|nr:flagellar motor protein MotB [Bradyrhizobium sp.]HXB77548.1 flagellar motor protein MotB [Bradyrhizobium sp.]